MANEITDGMGWLQVQPYPPFALPLQQVTISTWTDTRVPQLEARIAKLERQVRRLRRDRIQRARKGR